MAGTLKFEDYRTIVDSAPEAIVVYADGQFIYGNSFAAERLGYPLDALVGQPIMNFVHPDSIASIAARIKQVEQTEEAGPPVNVVFVARDGAHIQAEVVSVPIVFSGQKAILALIRDVALRVEAYRALREADERFANAFRHSPLGMAFVALDGSWLRANKSLCEMTGYSEEELLSMTFADITHPDDLPGDLEQLRALSSGAIDTYNRLKRYNRKDGIIVWVSVDVSAVRDSSGAPLYFIGQVQDITAQRALEAESAHARWLAGIGETAVAVAHELNNALTILTMNAELLAKDASPEEIPVMAREILESAGRIAATVDGLRRLADPKSIEYVGATKMLDLSSIARTKVKAKK